MTKGKFAGFLKVEDKMYYTKLICLEKNSPKLKKLKIKNAIEPKFYSNIFFFTLHYLIVVST